jgi:tetratricopeptide (TPR) repeat protein
MIAAVGILIYSNTLTATFQFDDKINIVDNPFIRNLGNLWPPTGRRWFGLLTFALNYACGGLNPVGYHIVNITIHLLAALSVYLFVRLTFKTPCFSVQKDSLITGEWLALASALLFVAHPIQTQAVTYVVQRFASLAALLFMLSINSYILARLNSNNRCPTAIPGEFGTCLTRVALYAAALFFALLSMLTKENAYTLPVIICLYDVMFISRPTGLLKLIRRRWLSLAAVAGVATVAVLFVQQNYNLLAMLERVKATNEISRHDYLVTQFRVIVTYLRLMLFPTGQTVDHHYRIYGSAVAPEIIASLALLTLLLGSALYACRASRDGEPCTRLAAFGIFWFFITLSVESGLIPIIDVMFEHRMYLPGIGVILTVSALILHLLEKLPLDRSSMRISAAGVLAVVVIALSATTYVRNRVWKNELTLWSDVIVKNPDNPRGYNMVGNYYQTRFRIYDAIGYFRKALEVDGSYAEARSNLGNAYILTGRVDEGLNELMITARNNRFDEIDTGILYLNIAKGFGQKGLPDLALENLNRALRCIPNEPAVYALLGELYRQKGLTELSEANLKKAHQLNPLKY